MELTTELLEQKLNEHSKDLRDRMDSLNKDLRDRLDSLKSWVIGIFIAGVVITGTIVGAFSSAVLVAMGQ